MTSFADDILPLFTPSQIRCMAGKGVFLDDFAYMSDVAGDDGDGPGFDKDEIKYLQTDFLWSPVFRAQRRH